MSVQVQAPYFLVAVENARGGWQKIGQVACDKRCKADQDLLKTFPRGTKTYEDVLKAVRFLKAESAANDTTWQAKYCKVRVIKIR